jgi:hypothetical protein
MRIGGFGRFGCFYWRPLLRYGSTWSWSWCREKSRRAEKSAYRRPGWTGLCPSFFTHNRKQTFAEKGQHDGSKDHAG